MTAARRRHQAWIRTLPFVSCGIDGRNEAGACKYFVRETSPQLSEEAERIEAEGPSCVR